VVLKKKPWKRTRGVLENALIDRESSNGVDTGMHGKRLGGKVRGTGCRDLGE